MRRHRSSQRSWRGFASERESCLRRFLRARLGSSSKSDVVGNGVFCRCCCAGTEKNRIWLANIFVSLVSLSFSAALLRTWRDLACLALVGLVQVELACVFLSAGSRRVPLPQGALIGGNVACSLRFLIVFRRKAPPLSTLIDGPIVTSSLIEYFLAMAGSTKGANFNE